MATKYGGYMGKILWIDLTTETTREYPFTDQQRKETLGGKTLSYHILHKELIQYSTGLHFQKAAPPAIKSTAPEAMTFL